VHFQSRHRTTAAICLADRSSHNRVNHSHHRRLDLERSFTTSDDQIIDPDPDATTLYHDVREAYSLIYRAPQLIPLLNPLTSENQRIQEPIVPESAPPFHFRPYNSTDTRERPCVSYANIPSILPRRRVTLVLKKMRRHCRSPYSCLSFPLDECE